MRKILIALLIIILLVVGLGYYANSRGWIALDAYFRWLPGSSGDLATTARVKAALNLSKRVKGFDVGVTTSEGVVTLSGQVTSEDVKSLAGEIARDTSGVSDVNNLIEVNPGTRPSVESTRVDDLEIRAEVLQAITRSAELSGKSIEVRVEDRVVSLSGTVENTAQKTGAEQVARSVDGVVGVSNELLVTNPQAPTEPPSAPAPARDANKELADRVEFELHRTGAFDILTMKVRADDGTVTISGNVRSRAEQLLAEKIAQGIPGVRKLNNELKVQGSPTKR
jgi:hyperosmotically inducible protein